MSDELSVTTPDSMMIKISNPPNMEIWVADDIVINCRAKYHWWNKLFLKLFLGWEIKEIKKNE